MLQEKSDELSSELSMNSIKRLKIECKMDRFHIGLLGLIKTSKIYKICFWMFRIWNHPLIFALTD